MKGLFVDALRRVNRATKGAGPVRRAAIVAYRNLTRLQRFLPPPRVLVNGPAKSGTHLLADCIAHLPQMAFSGRHLVPGSFVAQGHVDTDGMRAYLDRCPNGMFVTAHAPAWPEMVSVIDQLELRHLLLLRDPRDIVVSFVHFVAANPHLPRHRYFTEVLRNPHDRLLAAITGYRDGEHRLPSIGATLDDYLPWLDRPGIFLCRFEDLLGERGPNGREVQVSTVRDVSAFVDRTLSESAAADVADAAWSRHSLTFRSGEAGGWRDEFREEHCAAFKQVAGPQLVKMGYEDDLSW